LRAETISKRRAARNSTRRPSRTSTALKALRFQSVKLLGLGVAVHRRRTITTGAGGGDGQAAAVVDLAAARVDSQ
jgi:hypothetical protein